MRVILAVMPMATDALVHNHVILRVPDEFDGHRRRQGYIFGLEIHIDRQIHEMIVCGFCKWVKTAQQWHLGRPHPEIKSIEYARRDVSS